MSTVVINTAAYNNYVVTHFTEIRDKSLSINLYTVVRACIMAAESYSLRTQRLLNGGIYHLVIKAIPDSIATLLAKRLIDKSLYDELVEQYLRDKDHSLPDAVDEFMKMYFRHKDSSTSASNRESKCCACNLC